MANETNPQSEQEKEVNEIQSRISEWRNQLSKGWEGARESYNEQREKLVKWADEAKVKLNDASDTFSDDWHKLKTEIDEKLDDLKKTASETKDNSREALEHQRAELREKIDSLRGSMSEMAKTTKDEASYFWDSASDKFEDSQQRMDLFKLHFHLAQMDSEDALEAKRKEVSHQLAEFQARMKVKNIHSQEKLSEIKSELGSAWKNIRDIIKR